ncbi:hypothetical protein [Deinococcus arenicola]|uniref:Uncharacterized protein n=1 Tax=Deinococcus arenicola TaxID=2994950 RepID=A0ABU4DRI8_9DEIO|nr:hypothetical protein [Deinococcus sp. ZS9-10]MDV6375056.1 hypothetical protein [Deinococcus sp. ZS9-10]
MTLMAIPVAYLVSLVASVGLSVQKKSGPALAAAAFPFLYFVLAFVLAAAWASATSP